MKQQIQQACVFVTALSCEARPLLDKWKFKQIESSPFPIYYAVDKNWLLIVSGIGKKACATAVGYLGGKLASGYLTELNSTAEVIYNQSAIWINFGIAGHNSHPLGRGMMIHKIYDASPSSISSKGEVFYPFRLPYFDSEEIHCYDKPQSSYPLIGLVDMESAAFFYSASLFSNNELIHLYKVVSDNSQNSADNINKNDIIALLNEHTTKLQEITDKLLDMTQVRFTELHKMNQQVRDWAQHFIDGYHFSSTQKQQLNEQLRGCYVMGVDPISLVGALTGGLTPITGGLTPSKNTSKNININSSKKVAAEVIRKLKAELENTPKLKRS